VTIEIVSATRLTEGAFTAAPLGTSLGRISRDPRLAPHIAFANVSGLPKIYNARIDSSDASDILVFVHDDVWLEDFYIIDRVIEGLNHFDVIGVAGNRRRVPGQRSWAHSLETGKLDLPHLAGAIAHGDAPLGKVGFYGPIVAEVELLDGVFIATRKSALRDRGVRFDPRFGFHFYDLDFCRTARGAGLKLGTWPISMTHRSTGKTDDLWRDALAAYQAKWGD
jgi:GT2 family glycosyltransferase